MSRDISAISPETYVLRSDIAGGTAKSLQTGKLESPFEVLAAEFVP